MSKKMNVPKEVLMNIDFLNTINGGASVVSSEMEKSDKGYDIKMKAPGVSADDLQIEVVQDKLFVYHLMPVFSGEKGEGLSTVRFISKMSVPADADAEKISAKYNTEENRLEVFMPFDDEQKNFHLKVDIEK